MHLKIVSIFFILSNILQINSSVVPLAPSLRYTVVAPQNIRPFAAQISTFTKGLNVFDAPLAAGVLNPPAIVPRAVGLPSPAIVPAPAAVLPAPLTAPAAVLPAPLAPHIGAFPAGLAYSAPVGALPGPYLPHAHFHAAPAAFAAPVGPAASFVPAPLGALPEPYSPHAHFHAAFTAPIGVIPAPPAHVLPVPNARSIHDVAPAIAPLVPAPVVEAGVW